jgi:flagellar M-ring protein FliF
MDPADVAVIDADGQVLSAVGGSAADGLRDGQTGEYESRVAVGVQSMLDKLVGPGNAVVSVTAELDFDQTVRTTETVETDPDLPPLSSSTTTEEYTGNGTTDGGVLGPDNIAVPVGGEGGGTYSSESETVNNPYDTVTEQLTTAPGSVRRQSISVVVSEDAGGDLDLADLETAVAAAAGVDPERGDVVSVTRMAFDTTTAEEAEAALAEAEEKVAAAETMGLIKQAAVALAIIIGIAVLAFLVARRNKRARREALDLGVLQLLEARKAEALEGEALEMPALPAAARQAAVRDELEARREDVLALAAEQPAEVAEVLRSWLVGGRR